MDQIRTSSPASQHASMTWNCRTVPSGNGICSPRAQAQASRALEDKEISPKADQLPAWDYPVALHSQLKQYLRSMRKARGLTQADLAKRLGVGQSRVRPLSLSLPITPDRTVSGELVLNYFDKLLPDDERIRKRVATRFRTKSVEAFELLQAIGRDCVGAVQLLPPGAAPEGFDRIEWEPMTEEAIERHLRRVVSASGLGHDEDADDVRISIAGAQEKTALLRLDGQWCKPLGATPTTQALKWEAGRGH
jgi:HipA-like protein